MPRIHIFEFMDQSWYPSIFRSIQADYLQFVATQGDSYKDIVSLIIQALDSSRTNRIIDLCSGSSGP